MCSLIPTILSGLWEHRATVISQTTMVFFFFLFLLTIFICEAILLHACYIHPVVPRLIRLFIHDLKSHWLGLPWWYSGQKSTCLFWGQGFDPWSGKIPHIEEQLGPCSTGEATAMRSPCTTPRE